MSNRKGVTALVCLIVFGACDSPTFPEAATPAVPAELAVASLAGPNSTGAPIVDRQLIDVTFVIPCQTFDMQQHVYVRVDTRSWVNDDGSTRTSAHVQGRITFTNLTTGDWVANDIAFNEEVLVSADGLMVEIRDSGLLLKVRREAMGQQIAYQMGHATLTLDFSTIPPTVETSFSGRADGGAGPCVDLGDPA